MSLRDPHPSDCGTIEVMPKQPEPTLREKIWHAAFVAALNRKCETSRAATEASEAVRLFQNCCAPSYVSTTEHISDVFPAYSMEPSSLPKVALKS